MSDMPMKQRHAIKFPAAKNTHTHWHLLMLAERLCGSGHCERYASIEVTVRHLQCVACRFLLITGKMHG